MKMTLEEANEESKKKLNEFCCKKNPKGICVDYDGTLISPQITYDLPSSAIELVFQIAESGIISLVATARGVTMERMIIQEFSLNKQKKKNKNLTVYIAGANGRSLTKFINGKKEIILYDYPFTDKQLEAAIDAYKNVKPLIAIPGTDSVNDFQDFLVLDWDSSLLPQRYLDIAREFKGSIFIEPTKFSLVGPHDIAYFPKIIALLNEQIKHAGLSASWGGRDRFIHILPKLIEDGKLKALRAVANEEKIPLENFATFGDAPLGNDKGILTGVPYGFTNAKDFIQRHQKGVPPFILSNGNPPVHAVYSAIEKICHSSKENV